MLGARPLTLYRSCAHTSRLSGREFQRDVARRKELIEQRKAGGGAVALNPRGTGTGECREHQWEIHRYLHRGFSRRYYAETLQR